MLLWRKLMDNLGGVIQNSGTGQANHGYGEHETKVKTENGTTDDQTQSHTPSECQDTPEKREVVTRCKSDHG